MTCNKHEHNWVVVFTKQMFGLFKIQCECSNCHQVKWINIDLAKPKKIIEKE